MQTAHIANELITSIYDASLDPTAWTSSLLRISDTFGGSTTGIGMVNGAGQGDLVSVRCAPEALTSFATYYAQRNPMLQHLPTAEVGKPFTHRDLMTQAEWQRTEFYNDWGRAADNHGCLLMPVLRSDHWQGWFVVARTTAAGDFDQAHIELAALLAPHLRRAMEIGKRLEAARVSTAPLLEQMNIAAVCLDHTGRILWNNARADALIEAADGLRRIANNKLAAASQTTSAALQRLLRQSQTGTGGMLRLERRSGLPALIAIAVPLRDRAGERSDLPPQAADATTALFVVDSVARPSMSEDGVAFDGLRALYDLTVMEARVALRLASGSGIPAVADALGVAPSTIRSHTKSLYQKMNLHSQAELVSLIERITLFDPALS